MAKDYLTDKGIGARLEDEFAADLARFWHDRFQAFPQVRDLTDIKIREIFCKHLKNEDPQKIKLLILDIEDVFSDAIAKHQERYYQHGYKDGVRMILQSLI